MNGRLDRDALRVERPKHTVFLCGGLTPENDGTRTAYSVRDYLYRVRNFSRRINGTIVLAEAAQQLYRDTGYSDLITFEEDIARISSVVLVISESPGSLAELGAFASEPVIRAALRIIISEDHDLDESFVRYGPVKRIENDNRLFKGVFPWRTHRSNGHIVKRSISPHYSEICNFINQRINEIPRTNSYNILNEKAIFYDILWILSLFDLAPPDPLYEAVRVIHPDLGDGEIRDKLFVLKTCKWIDVFSYSGRDFYFLPENVDPFSYAFLEGERPRDMAALKLQIATEFQAGVDISRAVRRRLQEKRGEVV